MVAQVDDIYINTLGPSSWVAPVSDRRRVPESPVLYMHLARSFLFVVAEEECLRSNCILGLAIVLHLLRTDPPPPIFQLLAEVVSVCSGRAATKSWS